MIILLHLSGLCKENRNNSVKKMSEKIFLAIKKCCTFFFGINILCPRENVGILREGLMNFS